jgi:hypothetical protein
MTYSGIIKIYLIKSKHSSRIVSNEYVIMLSNRKMQFMFYVRILLK